MDAADPNPSSAEPREGGKLFLPTHGLDLRDGPIACHGLLFVQVDGATWNSIEALWMRDQELDAWQDRARTFALMPYEGSVGSTQQLAFAQAFAAYDAVVAAARLLAAGVWIDSSHLAAVARDDQGRNLRTVGSGRPRLWASVFGEPLTVRGRRREFRDRVECRPLQYHLPHGPAYVLDAERADRIQRAIAMLDELHNLTPHHAWWAAHRAFQRGHDIFLPRRLRLVSLLSAFEMLFGAFRRELGDPGVGVAVAALLERSGWEAQDPAAYVEGPLRQARNRLAHGSDLTTPMDFAAIEENLLDLLRVGLTFSSAWIRGIQEPDNPLPPGPLRSLTEFQRRLGRVLPED